MAEAERRQDMDFVQYARIIWLRRYTVLLTAVLAVLLALGVDAIRTRQYQGTAQIQLLSQNIQSNGSVVPLQPTDVSTDIALIQSAEVRTAAGRTLHIKSSLPTVSATEVGTTNVAQVQVTSTSPSLAARAANAYADAYVSVSSQRFLNTQLTAEKQIQAQINALSANASNLQGQLSNGSGGSSQSAISSQLTGIYTQIAALEGQLSSLQQATAEAHSGGVIISAASVPTSPSSPKPFQDAIIALVIGLIVGIGIALVRNLLDDRIRTQAELEHVTGNLPVLGLVPDIGEWRDSASTTLIAAEHPKSPTAEAYRALRTSIQFLSLDHPIRTLQVTSPAAGDGKTTTAANLACTIAQAGQRVILASCDLRKPRLHEFFGVPNTVGFTSVLVGHADLDQALVRIQGTNLLHLLPSGPIPPNPSELLGSSKAQELLSALGERADVVVVDTPPVLPVTDAAVVASQVDAVLLVATASKSTRRDVTRAMSSLGRVAAPLVGVVFNRASDLDSYAYYRYGYGYGYGYGTRSRNGRQAPDALRDTGELQPATAPRRRRAVAQAESPRGR